ncbi:MAG: hypothetical protein GSR86_06105 [Desulfurococcales archaeon]|nr:hypothetical protein [Desulfurococcales archaeon]
MWDGVEEMERLYLSWPSKLVEGFEKGLAARADGFRRVVFCGMGGSGVTGDMAGAVLGDEGVVSVTVKDAHPPRWISSEDLVIAVSYSGNTVETLKCLKESMEKAKTIVITSGGRMREIAGSHGIPVVELTPGYYPRTAMAEMVGAALGVTGVVDKGLVGGAASELKPDTAYIRGLAERMASSKYISIVSCSRLQPAARRLRSELAENSKMVAREEVYPESGHNDIVSWQQPQDLGQSFLLLEWEGDETCRMLAGLLKDLYSRWGNVYGIRSSSGTLLGALLDLSLQGGLLSVYLAGERGVDPRSTDVITLYKDIVKRVYR